MLLNMADFLDECMLLTVRVLSSNMVNQRLSVPLFVHDTIAPEFKGCYKSRLYARRLEAD